MRAMEMAASANAGDLGGVVTPDSSICGGYRLIVEPKRWAWLPSRAIYYRVIFSTAI
ncbi:hypothetical protein GCM10010412_011160 [Nonomuraea recticatena]|uniref:Uncharacterized protein n=1 Tax=Nonomuraea recticatena TaxID=46178 RepID=A0ABN3RA40_9ACTN